MLWHILLRLSLEQFSDKEVISLNILIFLLTVFAVWQILVHFGVFEFSKGQKVVIEDIKIERNLNKKRRFEKRKLNFFASVTEMFRGILLSDFGYTKHQYYIERLNIRSEILDRQLSPEELRGKYAVFLIIGLFCLPLGVFFSIFLLVTGASIIVFVGYGFIYSQKIQDEDEVIDNNFLNLYLLMYSKLRLGSKARLQTVVESYINTLDSVQDQKEKETMLKLAEFLLNNLTLYEDHVAITKLRDRYHSATVINFCNVAAQALQGIDNSDNLLTFKMSLVRRKTKIMEEKALKLCKQGERAIYAIYVILFIFIGVGWYSKLPAGFF